MYDLAVIGGGPGGYVAAERAGAAGLKVVLFERKSLGGVCLNEGCIPTKTLLYSAKVYNYALTGDHYGVYVKEPTFDYSKIVARKDKVVKKLVGGVKLAMKSNNVEVVAAEAMIQGRDAEGIKITAADQTYAARNILICTGSEAAVPPFPGLKEAGDVIVTNREILSLKERPSELVVIGGGVIGMEFAAFYSTLGTKVTVVEMLPKILGPLDDEISAMLQKIYTKRGVNFCLKCKVTGIEGNTVVYEDPEGNTQRVGGDKILVSVGRRANITGFGLDNLGVEMLLNRGGKPCGIKVDSRMRTNIPGVYAAGDRRPASLCWPTRRAARARSRSTIFLERKIICATTPSLESSIPTLRSPESGSPKSRPRLPGRNIRSSSSLWPTPAALSQRMRAVKEYARSSSARSTTRSSESTCSATLARRSSTAPASPSSRR